MIGVTIGRREDEGILKKNYYSERETTMMFLVLLLVHRKASFAFCDLACFI